MFKQLAPRMSNRSQDEVCEDAIAEIKIQEIQQILKEEGSYRYSKIGNVLTSNSN